MTNDIDTIKGYAPNDLTEASVNLLAGQMKEARDSLFQTSKEKYTLKAQLVENADDMTTKEKLDALDQNYDCYCKEVWQEIIVFGVVSLTFIGIAVGKPVIVKNVRRLIA